VLRTIATKKADGFSHREIAGQLRMGLSSVEERVRLVKALLATRMSDAD
jgi:DNA-directed RNA polymerase specialized sigma24 family protein